MISARRRLLKESFGFVRNNVLAYSRDHPTTFSYVNHSLFAHGLDIALNEDQFVQHCSRPSGQRDTWGPCPTPYKVLDIYDDVLADNPEEGQPRHMERVSARQRQQMDSLPRERQPEQDIVTISSNTGSTGPHSGRATRLSMVSDISDKSSITTHRGDTGINDISLRQTFKDLFAGAQRQRNERRKTVSWDRDTVAEFDAVAAAVRPRILELKEHFDRGCGLSLNDFQILRRNHLMIDRN